MYQRQVSFGEAINRAVAQNYCNFSGRSSRSEYWWYVLFTAIIGCGVSFIFSGNQTTMSIISGIVNLVLLLPGLGLCVRRLHDTNRSGWWILIGFIPVVGWILLIVWFCQDSQRGSNQYGPEPNLVA